MRECPICNFEKSDDEFQALHSECAGPAYSSCAACVKTHIKIQVAGKHSVRVACPLGAGVCKGEILSSDIKRMGCVELADMLGNNQCRDCIQKLVGLQIITAQHQIDKGMEQRHLPTIDAKFRRHFSHECIG